MFHAWVFWYDPLGKKHYFEERQGDDHRSTDPTAWGLSKDCTILLVLQKASFIAAFVQGKPTKEW